MARRKSIAAGKASSRAKSKKAWQDAFLQALSETSNVTAAAKRAEVDTSLVYKCRRSEAGFNRRWQQALAEGYDNLEMDLLHRLRIGQLEGGKAQARRKFDNAVALRLLIAHREAVGRQRAMRAVEDEDAIIASINRKIDTMKVRRAALQETTQDNTDRDTDA